MKIVDLKVLSVVFGVSLASMVTAGPMGQLPMVPAPVTDVIGPYGEGVLGVELAFDEDAQLWLAQSTGEKSGRDYDRDTGGSKLASSLNDGTTKMIIRIIKDANRTCASAKMDPAYRADCLRVYYGWVADKLADKGEYAPIKQAMQQAEAKLERIIRANLDPAAEPIQPREGFKPNSKRLPPLRAVKKSATKKVARQAAAVVEEAELLIIRSSGDPARRTPHFTKVADAVEDNLLILRSA